MLIFFTNTRYLSDAFDWVRYHCNLTIGDRNSICRMYQLTTDPHVKADNLIDLSKEDGKAKIVFCSSSLSMGINLSRIEYVLHYGPPTTADAFFQETGRAARESDIHAHSIMLTFPRMAAGRKLDNTMKAYVKSTQCLRNTLLAKFMCIKPIDQQMCCDICEKLSCTIKDAVVASFASSETDSFSESDSEASAGQIEHIGAVF